MGARRMTVSTSGVVPFIDKLADEPLQVNLAISIHAPNDELRSQLVPINRKHPIADLMAAVDRYTDKTHRRVSFEYALMSGINDSDEIALEMAELMRGRLCHLNVIPFNKVDVLEFERPTADGIERFARWPARRHAGDSALLPWPGHLRRLRPVAGQATAEMKSQSSIQSNGECVVNAGTTRSYFVAVGILNVNMRTFPSIVPSLVGSIPRSAMADTTASTSSKYIVNKT